MKLDIRKREDLFCPKCGGALTLADDKVRGLCLYCDSAYLLNEEELYILKAHMMQSKPLRSNYIEIVSEICGSHKTWGECLKVSYSMKKSLIHKRKLKKVRKYFLVPEQDDVFLIFNGDLAKPYSLGFALCTSGFYYCENIHQKTGKLTWEEFREQKIVAAGNNYLSIGDLFFEMQTEVLFSPKEIEDLLHQIQQRI